MRVTLKSIKRNTHLREGRRDALGEALGVHVHVLGSTRAARQRRDLEETEPNRDVVAVMNKTRRQSNRPLYENKN